MECKKKKKPIQGTDTHFFKADILTGKSHLARRNSQRNPSNACFNRKTMKKQCSGMQNVRQWEV